MTTNLYNTCNINATENFEFPKQFIEWLNSHSSLQHLLLKIELKELQNEAFYNKYSQLVSYRLKTGTLTLQQIPGYQKFWDFYKGTSHVRS